MLVEGIRDLQQDAALKGAPNATDAENETGATAEGEIGASAAAGGKSGGKLTVAALLLQGVATSIDALSVGFTIADYTFPLALLSAAIIGAVTFLLCFLGVHIGKRFGTHLAGRATIVGGLILIGIGIEIFVKGVFFS